MGRRRATETDLPMRLQFKHGAYWYVCQNGGRPKWERLGTDKQQCVTIANKLNMLKKQDRIRVMGVSRDATAEVRDQVFARDNHQCVYCGSKKDLGLDHFIPFSQGGSGEPFNLVVSCTSCNFSKGDSSPVDFWMAANQIKETVLEQALSKLDKSP